MNLWALLTTAFVVLKITGHLKWKWPWVLAPVWIPVALVLLMGLGYLIGTFSRGIF